MKIAARQLHIGAQTNNDGDVAVGRIVGGNEHVARVQERIEVLIPIHISVEEMMR